MSEANGNNGISAFGSGGESNGNNSSKEARLVLIDLASGELHGQHRYRLSQAPPQTAARTTARRS